ncbi:MAG TPA: sugar transferase [Gaiellaceae bacterium]|nr:sugar transferase [Gaiellaceae bacterium]
MGVQSYEVVEGIALDGLSEAPRLQIGRRTAITLALFGRLGVVWLPLYAMLQSRVPSLAGGLELTTVLALVWFVGLHKAFEAARLTLLSLGPATAAALGTALGWIAASAASVWVDLHLAPVDLLETAVTVFILSWVWESVVTRSVAARRRVLMIGSDETRSVAAEVRGNRDLPFEICGIVDSERPQDIAASVQEHRPDIVVLGDEGRTDVLESLLDLAGFGFKLVGVAEFYEHAFGRVPVETLRVSWFANVLHLYQRPYTRAAKRGFDVAVAAIGLLAVSWVLPILWLAVKRCNGAGPVIFRQTRLGEGGRHFTIYKFRTMRNDAEATGAVWASQDDPRITKLGKLMRKTRLDELPQLVNVLMGDMSIVGPRPERPEFLEQLHEAVPFWTRRHLVKPGITGWAQVRRGYTADAGGTAEKLAYDLWYLRHRSLVIDLAICVKTFTTCVTGSGAR